MLADSRICLLDADITGLDVDAIVNAANTALAAGGGVCGAIFRAAGPGLASACNAIGGCPTGEARITDGFDLKARHIIHAVGPIWRGGTDGEDELLACAYRNSLSIARDHGLASIAFPAISTGIYGFPADRAARLAVATVGTFLAENALPARVVLVCFGVESLRLHETALAERRAAQNTRQD
jgi:O-acetyl-ADP-ribose deacetylase